MINSCLGLVFGRPADQTAQRISLTVFFRTLPQGPDLRLAIDCFWCVSQSSPARGTSSAGHWVTAVYCHARMPARRLSGAQLRRRRSRDRDTINVGLLTVLRRAGSRASPFCGPNPSQKPSDGASPMQPCNSVAESCLSAQWFRHCVRWQQ